MTNYKQYVWIVGMVLGWSQLCAATHQVGPTRTYVSPNALYEANVLVQGDTVEIDAGTYSGTAALAVWHADSLVIRGVGGRPHLDAASQNIWGKGIWVCNGNDITVENIEFSGATVPDENGAGIRLDKSGLIVRHCYFHDNENGILTSNPGDGDILIEYSEFARNGFGDGFTHNLYIGKVHSLTFRFNYSHHAIIGHNLKSRATTNVIYCNRIMDENTGTSSRLIDLSNGGLAIVMGNLLMQGPNAPNKNLVGYGLEGLSNPAPHELHFINNTCVNKRVASCTFVHIQSGTTVANISNSIFAGSGALLDGTSTTMANNLVETTIANVRFVNEALYDYHLQSSAPAIDMGTLQADVHGNSLTPDASYQHLAMEEPRMIVNSIIDVGAYEEGVVLPIELVSFHGYLDDDQVVLQWQTALEHNNEGFRILRSIDGQDFHDIGWLEGQGDDATVTDYTFIDAALPKKTYYYQLVQVDFDGSFWRSHVVSIHRADVQDEVYPNPASDDLFFSDPHQGRVQILSLNGKVLISGEASEGHLNLQKLPQGAYLVNHNGKIARIMKR